MIDKFKVIQETSEGFSYGYDVDYAGHLMKLFWADAISRRNFELYGDVVSFDATFDTNNWAFGHLVKAMGRNPVVIVTDQCDAMKVAVPAVFSDLNGLITSRHRLCMWHIMEKFPVKLGNRLCKKTDFMEKMKAYIWSSFIEIDELERWWNESAMDKQRNETTRLDHESKSTVPTTLSKWFIEDDASDLFTRSIFYKVQEERIASCLQIQIKRMSEEIDGVTHMEIRDVRVKDKLFKQISVTKFPRNLVLNRWMKIANSGTSSNLDVVTKDYFKMEQVSLKLTSIWFDFRQAINKAGVQIDRLDHVHNTVKQLNSDLDDHDGHIVDFTKKGHMAAMVGQQPSGEVTFLAPNVCKNKVNYFKRLISEREKTVMKSKKRIRKCKTCNALTHMMLELVIRRGN
ncbi:hypothetical protein POM88_005778 [Heracleum sosnowskyi]|uniref:MULE transposase domain-containing protein n=1 Tax=Heracleum sosnowskyi TaxID=360622 RepID=A0AAD8J1C1_9APIA|nr:hypothetical protein POM88_005778 [Heracleum sosnowskyi]